MVEKEDLEQVAVCCSCTWSLLFASRPIGAGAGSARPAIEIQRSAASKKLLCGALALPAVGDIAAIRARKKLGQLRH